MKLFVTGGATSQLNHPQAKLCRVIEGEALVTAAGETSWYEFAKAILEEATHASRVPSWFAAIV
jgi:dTDP-4-dehydrorhamnose reductase